MEVVSPILYSIKTTELFVLKYLLFKCLFWKYLKFCLLAGIPERKMVLLLSLCRGGRAYLRLSNVFRILKKSYFEINWWLHWCLKRIIMNDLCIVGRECVWYAFFTESHYAFSAFALLDFFIRSIFRMNWWIIFGSHPRKTNWGQAGPDLPVLIWQICQC